VQEAVAALARHVCLKAPDRADPRANAIRAAAAMAPLLAQWEQDQFVGFVFHLSRSSKVRGGGGGRGPALRDRWTAAAASEPPATAPLDSPRHPHTRVLSCAPQIAHRSLAVGLARELLMHLPEPFKQSTFEAAAASAGATPAADGMVPAPWSVVCLAALLHRCSDKAAAVRARALSDLAEVVACFGELLARDPASDEYRVAERFVAGLVAAAQLQVGPRTRARGAGAGAFPGGGRGVRPASGPWVWAAGALPGAAVLTRCCPAPLAPQLPKPAGAEKKATKAGVSKKRAGSADESDGEPEGPEEPAGAEDGAAGGGDGMDVDGAAAPGGEGAAVGEGGDAAADTATAAEAGAAPAVVAAFEALIPRRLQSVRAGRALGGARAARAQRQGRDQRSATAAPCSGFFPGLAPHPAPFSPRRPPPRTSTPCWRWCTAAAPTPRPRCARARCSCWSRPSRCAPGGRATRASCRASRTSPCSRPPPWTPWCAWGGRPGLE
jgi:hypothetical protein